MTAADRQRERRAQARADLAASRARHPSTEQIVVATVIRMTELPLPETVAAVRRVHGANAVIVVAPRGAKP